LYFSEIVPGILAEDDRFGAWLGQPEAQRPLVILQAHPRIGTDNAANVPWVYTGR